MVKAKCAAGIGLRGCWRGSELNGHPRGHEHEPRTEEERVCREDAGCFGREVVVVAVVVESSSRSAQHCHRVTHMHAHREDGEEKQTQRVTPVKKVVKNAPDMQVASSAVHERDGSPQRRSNHGDSSFSNYSNGPVGAARLSPGSLLDAFLWGSTTGTAQANGDGPLV